MGTRSLTRVFDEWSEEEIVRIYRQMDGYPTGHGLELAEFCDGMVIVNGISSDTPEKAANGMGCFAAQLVKYLKEDIGSIYLEAIHPFSSGDYGEEYEYQIRKVKNGNWV